MQQLKDTIFSKVGLTAIGSGIALVGSYFFYKNIKDSLLIDSVAENINIDQEELQKNSYISRNQMLAIFTDSINLIAQEIKSKQKKLAKQGVQLLKAQNYEDYADMLLEFEDLKIQREMEAIKQLCEHLGVNDEVFNSNLSQHYQSSKLQNQVNIVDEYKERVTNKWTKLYKDEVNHSPLLQLDFLDFKYLIENKLVTIIEKNQKIFDCVIKRIIEQKPAIEVLFPCMETLAYHLFFIETNYSQFEVRFTELKFKETFLVDKSENSTNLLNQLKITFKELQKGIVKLLEVRHRSEVAQLMQQKQ